MYNVQQQQKTKHTTPQNVTKTKHLIIICLLFYLMVFVCIYCNYLLNPIKTLIHQKSSLEFQIRSSSKINEKNCKVCILIYTSINLKWHIVLDVFGILHDAAEMFSNSAKHLFGIYMLFAIILYLCKFINLIYMLF